MIDLHVHFGTLHCKSFMLTESRSIQAHNVGTEYYYVSCYQLDIISNLNYYLTLKITILLSGDIESNPGPVSADGCLKEFSVVHLNVRSIRTKLELIFNDVSDILCFTETHLDDIVSNNYLLSECSNFTLYRRDLPADSGGVVVYVSNRLFSKRRHDLELPSVQSIWLEIKHSSSSFLICSTYRPPNPRVSLWKDLNIRVV